MQTVVVVVVVGILTVFSIATLSNLDLDLLAFSGYPSVADIVSSVALTFFAFLGFGVITFTAKDLADPRRQLPKAVYLALAIATVVYVAVALGVFGTLTVDEVIDSGGTALAVAAEPVLGSAGYWLMSVTALFATAGATNSGLYPAAGLGDEMAAVGQFPPVMGRRVGGHAAVGIVVTAIAAILLALFFDLNAIASIGSAVALIVFTLVTLRSLPDPARDRSPGVAAHRCRSRHRHRSSLVRSHDAGQRARHHNCPGGDRGAQPRSRSGLEEPQDEDRTTSQRICRPMTASTRCAPAHSG